MDKHLYWNKPWSNRQSNEWAISPFGVHELETTLILLLFFHPQRVSSFFFYPLDLNRDEWEILNHLKRVEFRINISSIAEHLDNNHTRAEYIFDKQHYNARILVNRSQSVLPIGFREISGLYVRQALKDEIKLYIRSWTPELIH